MWGPEPPPCHNRSYLSVGGEWIPSMNNRSLLIFLGELRPPILQLISGFLIFTYSWLHLLVRETRSITQSSTPLPYVCPVKNSKMWSGSQKNVTVYSRLTPPPKSLERGRVWIGRRLMYWSFFFFFGKPSHDWCLITFRSQKGAQKTSILNTERQDGQH